LDPDHYGNSDTPFLGFQWVFLLCSLTGIADIVLHCFMEEPEHERPLKPFPGKNVSPNPLKTKVSRSSQSPSPHGPALRLCFGYTIGVPGFFSMVHLRETFGASFSQASFIFITACLGAAIFTPGSDAGWIVPALRPVLMRLVFLQGPSPWRPGVL